MPSPKKGARPKKAPAARAAAPAKKAAPKRRPAPAAARATAREASKAEGSAAVAQAAAEAPEARAGRPAGRTIVIEQYASGIGCQFRQKLTLRALGLRRLRQRVVRPDNHAVRGMVEAIPHLIRIVEDGHGA